MFFTKMHGIGNDYIIINLFDNNINNLKELSIKLSNRNYGIGGDGIITIEPSKICDFKMRIYNSDGSEAEMCGNGIRCLGKYVYDNKMTDKELIKVETKSGVKVLKLHIKDKKVSSVTVDMGEPVFIDNIDLNVLDNNYSIHNVSMGNPHAVTIVDNVDSIDVKNIGSLISNNKHFPNKTNVEFIELIDKNNIKMRVYERGSGETLACGTGASASVASCNKMGLTNRKVKVKLLGGDLDIKYDINNHLYMTGSVAKVFDGNIDI